MTSNESTHKGGRLSGMLTWSCKSFCEPVSSVESKSSLKREVLFLDSFLNDLKAWVRFLDTPLELWIPDMLSAMVIYK